MSAGTLQRYKVLMGTKRTRSLDESDNGDKLSIPPGFVSLTSFTLKKVKHSDKACDSVARGSEAEQGPSQFAATSTIISAGKLKRSIRHKPWILDHHVDHVEQEFECEADKALSSRACLPKGVIRGCSGCHNCQKVVARWHPEVACMPPLEEAPVFHPSEEEFKDTLKYVASIRPHVEHFGVCRIVPPTSWRPPCLFEEEITWEAYGVDTHIQRISDLQSLLLKKRPEGAHKKDNKERKIPSTSVYIGRSMECKEFGCCTQKFEFDSGPEFTLKSFKNYADYFKSQYFIKEDQITESNVCSNVMEVLSEPSILDIEGEYWRIIENPTEEIEVLLGNSKETTASRSGFPLKFNPRDVTDYPQYVESGWNLNNTPKLQDSLLRFESCESSSILLPQLSIGMCFSSNIWRIEEHHLYLLSYLHFGAPRIFYGVPGSYRCKFEEVVKKHLPELSAHTWLLHNHATQFSPSTMTSEGIPVYRCVQNPKEFVLILPGAYHAEFDSGFNCSEAVNFSPFDWLPHGLNAVELYREQVRKTSISHDKLLLEAAAEAVGALVEISLLIKNPFDSLKWRAVCGSNGILTKALKSRVKSEVRRRKYLCAALELRKMEDDFCTTTKRECIICFYDLYLSAIGCKCSPDKYTCLLHAKQLCSCAWSDRYLLIRNEIDELNNMVEALDGKASIVHKLAREKLGLALHSDVSKDATKDGGTVPSMETVELCGLVSDVRDTGSISHHLTSRISGLKVKGKSVSQQTSDIQQDNWKEALTPTLGPSATSNYLPSKENAHDENEVLKKRHARESSSTGGEVIILSDDED